jgi:hypothetical protein
MSGAYGHAQLLTYLGDTSFTGLDEVLENAKRVGD